MNDSGLSLDPGIRFILFVTTIALLLLLATKELVSAMDSKLNQRIGRFLNGPIVSLLVIFIVIIFIVVRDILH